MALIVAFLFALASVCSAELPFTTTVDCPVRCSLALSQAWAKTLGFDIPTNNMIGDRDIFGSNDTFTLMCSLYSTYTRCLKGCDASEPRNKAVFNAVPSYTQACTDQLHEFDELAPCLLQHTNTFQRACQKENEDALAAATRMVKQLQLQDELLNEYCGASSTQVYCIFPAIRQTCGDETYELIRSVASASFTGIRISVGAKNLQNFFPQCESYLTTLETGIETPSTNATVNETTTTAQTTAITTIMTNMTNTTTYVSTTTVGGNGSDVIRKDEADPYDGTGAPQYQTTTPSSAQHSRPHFIALFIIFMIFFLF